MDEVRLYQHVHQAIHGSAEKRDDDRRSGDAEGQMVYTVQESSPAKTSATTDPTTSARLKALEDAIGKLQQSLEKLSSNLHINSLRGDEFSAHDATTSHMLWLTVQT